jgi:hypothetical protein
VTDQRFLPDGRHLGWYVNLREPYRRSERGIHAMDMILDIVVSPDRSWLWKDEDEFEAIVAAGLYTEATVLAVREEAASVIRRIENCSAPFDGPWRQGGARPLSLRCRSCRELRSVSRNALAEWSVRKLRRRDGL